ncbi:methylated-DNA--[protein]-cysteine S-methyltransferase [Helicobacter sp. MIT 14-3879]|uniref:methylated-DNA--[protein]-cysteine S-methyltransferase n=1 Tax=Helicobacter sp. MIT 14-3879 TaxID=2040649 RepID=UPI000E1F425F|nr:methylated-DNA--[protein]-cysteine S-methyltransferase [Helicobacter sp. MIT 14-3879]RDU65069.1 6-O-methylguanine DNA methyltransferase [Helicobacter sp. MIT 14-3879]
MLYKTTFKDLVLLSDSNSLVGLYFYSHFSRLFHDVVFKEESNIYIFKQAKDWLNIYFRGKIPDFTPKISLDSTPFRLSVWEVLKEIPYGKTISYKEVANIIAKKRNIDKMSSQAVGNAVSKNPISIIIPCHRVIGSDGSLVGYAGGLENKLKLLNIENATKSI